MLLKHNQFKQTNKTDSNEAACCGDEAAVLVVPGGLPGNCGRDNP